MAEKSATVSRFAALDGMRGFFALVVALGHLRVDSHVYPLDLAERSYTIVDLFFVLSGLVIGRATQKGISDKRRLLAFMLRRFGRVWPAHVAVLMMYIGFELLKLRAEMSGNLQAGRHAFEPGTQFDLASIPANLVLVQSMGIFDRATWNVPAWSISTELYTYVLFAFCSVLLPRRLLGVAVVGSILCGAFIFTHAPNMNVTYDYGFARTVMGFFCGYLVFRAWRALPPLPTKWATPAELLSTLGLFLFFGWGGATRFSILAPVLYLVPIWVFAFDGGIVSRGFLMKKPLQLLGVWSYSIYLVHEFIYLVLTRGLTVLQNRFGVQCFVERGTWPDGTPISVISFGGIWTMDLLTVVMLATVTVIAAGMSRWIEVPCQRPFQNWARRLEGKKDPAVTVAAAQVSSVPAP
jgi:peptidoglycan/LPS O-acetylase OafA/YrhL